MRGQTADHTVRYPRGRILGSSSHRSHFNCQAIPCPQMRTRGKTSGCRRMHKIHGKLWKQKINLVLSNYDLKLYNLSSIGFY